MALSLGGVVIDEGDEFQVGAVREEDEAILGFAVGVGAAWANGEVVGEPGGRVEDVLVGEEEDGMVKVSHRK